MSDLDDRLLEMALALELGGTIAGEDAARTIREAMDRIAEDRRGRVADARLPAQAAALIARSLIHEDDGESG